MANGAHPWLDHHAYFAGKVVAEVVSKMLDSLISCTFEQTLHAGDEVQQGYLTRVHVGDGAQRCRGCKKLKR